MVQPIVHHMPASPTNMLVAPRPVDREKNDGVEPETLSAVLSARERRALQQLNQRAEEERNAKEREVSRHAGSNDKIDIVA
ncbi:MAG: hypothetical protein HOL85_17860 [Rhodospirillaceae bacterium]|jgi:hypothetical protein|nr:hypothetical protein [Rhodospirillaceae bacterium]MBT6139067.1 hypothetical protein [Rhodospirillaceae bacterium]